MAKFKTNNFIMIAAQKSHTLTWETSESTGTMKVLEIVCYEHNDTCSEGQAEHEVYDSNGDVLVCKEVEEDKWKWQKKD